MAGLVSLSWWILSFTIYFGSHHFGKGLCRLLLLLLALVAKKNEEFRGVTPTFWKSLLFLQRLSLALMPGSLELVV